MSRVLGIDPDAAKSVHPHGDGAISKAFDALRSHFKN